MMELGLGVLQLAPRDFWNATPREITAAFGGPKPQLARTGFDDLMKRYPD
jgi:uncharacterized phage protein (TIGR02216 family)